MRCVHTASTIGAKFNTKVNIEEGLYEWLVPSLLIDRQNTRTYPQSASESRNIFPQTINGDYKSLNPYDIDDTNEKFSFPEDETKLLKRCYDTLHLILKSNSIIDTNNIIIVAHAPCVQSLAFAMEEGVDDVKDSKLSKWPLGGITQFSREIQVVENDPLVKPLVSYGPWIMGSYGVTDHMPGEYKNGAGLWSLPCFTEL